MSLQTRALILQLNVSVWSANKLDKHQSKLLAQRNGVDNGLARVNKSLLPYCQQLDDLSTIAGAIRTHHYKNTLPWAGDGMHILPTSNFLAYMTEFRTLKDRFEVKKRELIQDYPNQVLKARHVLGSLFNPDDYPQQWELDKRYGVELAKYPVPDTDFRVQLSNAETNLLKQELQERLQSAQADALKAAWQRLYDRVKHIADQTGKAAPRIHDSLIDNAREVCDTLTRLNVFNDTNLDQTRQQVEAMLVSPDALRVSPTVKEQVHTEAKRIQSVMETFFNPSEDD